MSTERIRSEEPVKNSIHNLIQTLSVKLDSAARYGLYQEDARKDGFDDCAELFGRLATAEQQAIRDLLACLQKHIREGDAARPEEARRGGQARGEEKPPRQAERRQRAGSVSAGAAVRGRRTEVKQRREGEGTRARRARGRVNPIQVQKFLKGVDYPARREDLLRHAEEQGADENVRAALEGIPDREYEGPSGVSEEIGRAEG